MRATFLTSISVNTVDDPGIVACGMILSGLRVFDIRDPYRPEEIAALVPPAPARLMDPRPGREKVIQSADVFVDSAGLIYCTDYSAGLYILELVSPP